MRKQITFSKQYEAIEWVTNLNKCFDIKSLSIKRIFKRDAFLEAMYPHWRMIVEYE